jgi:hypothetical protein
LFPIIDHSSRNRSSITLLFVTFSSQVRNCWSTGDTDIYREDRDDRR